jgi:hypothetical protein
MIYGPNELEAPSPILLNVFATEFDAPTPKNKLILPFLYT